MDVKIVQAEIVETRIVGRYVSLQVNVISTYIVMDIKVVQAEIVETGIVGRYVPLQVNVVSTYVIYP